MKPLSVSSKVNSAGRQLMAGQQAGDARIQPHIADVVDADVHGQHHGLARPLPQCALCDGLIQSSSGSTAV